MAQRRWIIMFFLIVSIFFMWAMALSMRLSSQKADPLALTSISRIIAGAVIGSLAIFSTPWGDFGHLWASTGTHIVIGTLCFWLAGFTSLKAVSTGPLGITWTVVRLSMVLPTVASIFYWLEIPVSMREPLFVLRVSGLAFAVTAVVLIGIRNSSKTTDLTKTHQPLLPWALWLAGAFLSQGTWEVVLRASGSLPDDASRSFFISMVFAGAMILSIPILLTFRPKIGKSECSFGMLVAICSLLASGMRPWALKSLPGTVVFPVTAITVTLLVLLSGRLVWKERLGVWGSLGAVAALLSILLLTMNV